MFSADWLSSPALRRFPRVRSQENFVSQDTQFKVTVSADAQHFRVVISDMWVGVGGADETGFGAMMLPTFCPINEMRE